MMILTKQTKTLTRSIDTKIINIFFVYFLYIFFVFITILGKIQKKIYAHTFIEYQQKAKFKELPALFAEYIPKAEMHAVSNNLKVEDYTPASVFIKWDEEKEESESARAQKPTRCYGRERHYGSQ